MSWSRPIIRWDLRSDEPSENHSGGAATLSSYTGATGTAGYISFGSNPMGGYGDLFQGVGGAATFPDPDITMTNVAGLALHTDVGAWQLAECDSKRTTWFAMAFASPINLYVGGSVTNGQAGASFPPIQMFHSTTAETGGWWRTRLPLTNSYRLATTFMATDGGDPATLSQKLSSQSSMVDAAGVTVLGWDQGIGTANFGPNDSYLMEMVAAVTTADPERIANGVYQPANIACYFRQTAPNGLRTHQGILNFHFHPDDDEAADQFDLHRETTTPIHIGQSYDSAIRYGFRGYLLGLACGTSDPYYLPRDWTAYDDLLNRTWNEPARSRRRAVGLGR